MSFRSCLLFLLVFSACESTIDINSSEDYTPKLVVDGFFNPDSVWSMMISQSLPLNSYREPSELLVENANVSIQGNSGYQETLMHSGNGIYLSKLGIHPSANETYRLDITSPGFENVFSISHAPELESTFLDIQAVNTDSTERPIYRLHFSVNDLPNKSFYRVSVYQVIRSCLRYEDSVRRFDKPEGVPAFHRIRFESSDPSLFDSASTLDEPPIPFNQYYGPFVIAYFSDQLFENEEREFEIFVRPFISEIDPVLRFRLLVTSINEDLVLHYRSLSLQDDYLTGTDPILLGNPINIYSNIEGGLGIFTGFTNHSYHIDADGNQWTPDEVGLGEPLPLCN